MYNTALQPKAINFKLMKTKQLFFSLLAAAALSTASAQVGINTETPATTLDVVGANTGGALDAADGVTVPRVSTDMSTTATAGTTNGQMVYSTADNNFYYWDGAAWTCLGCGAGTTTKWDISATEVETNTTVNGAQIYAIRKPGTTTGTTTEISVGAFAVAQFRGAKIYDPSGNILLLETNNGNYNSGTGTFITGDGMVNTLLPAGTYVVELYYTK